MTTLRSLVLFALSAVLMLQSPWNVQAQHHDDDMMGTTICSCSLTTRPENETGCRVYGYYLDHLMPWKYVDFRCLREFNLTGDEIDVNEVAIMCPYSNGTDADVTAIVDAFRTDTPIGSFLKSQFGEYFALDNETGTYDWLPTIQSENNAQPVDCSGEAAFCYQVLTIYLSQSEQAANELAFVCGEVHKRFYQYASDKQAQVREALCSSASTGGVNSSSVCFPLYEQIMAHADASGNVDCTGIGNPPGNDTDVPAVCEGPVDSTEDGGDSGTEESKAAFLSTGFALLSTLVYILIFK